MNGFPFFNEVDLLYFKLKELSDVVDYFVIVESCETHSGDTKPFYFDSQRSSPRFVPYRNQIVYIKLEHTLENGGAWEREAYQRNMILTGLEYLKLSDDDIVLIGDLDEIPDPHNISKIKNNQLIYTDIVRLRQDMYYYNFNCKSTYQFTGLFYASYGDIKNMNDNGFTLTMIRRLNLPVTPEIHGWHLSYFGGVESIQTKMKSFVHHTEYDHTKYSKEYISDCITHQKNLYHQEDAQHVYDRFQYISIHHNPYLPHQYPLLLTNET